MKLTLTTKYKKTRMSCKAFLLDGTVIQMYAYVLTWFGSSKCPDLSLKNWLNPLIFHQQVEESSLTKAKALFTKNTPEHKTVIIYRELGVMLKRYKVYLI